MNENDRQTIFSYCIEKRLVAGDVLFEYDDPGEDLFFLSEGHLAVHKFTGFRHKMQVVALLDSGAVIGEAALLDGHNHRTKVTAIADCLLFCLTQKKYRLLQAEHPVLAARFFRYLLLIVSLRLEKTSERLAQIL